MKNYLEDIVDEDIKKRNKKPFPRTRFDEILDLITTKPPIGFIVRHPIVSASLEFIILTALYERARSIQPDLFNPFMEERKILASAYAIYIGAANLGDFHEKKGNIFYIKPDKKGIYRLYKFLLNNPRLVALFASASAAFAKYTIEYNVFAELQNVKEFSDLSGRAQARIVGVTFGAVSSAGISTELALRGLRALRRIKKSARQKKASLEEKIWNFIFEHPIALSAAATTAITYARYSVHSEKYSGRWFEDIVNNTSVAFSFMLESLIAGAAVLAVTTTAGSFLHSNALRENLLRLKRAYFGVIGHTEKAIETQCRITSLPNSAERRIEDMVELGNMYAYSGDEERAFETYRRSLRLFYKKSDEISYAELFRRPLGLGRLERWLKKRKAEKQKQDINTMFIGLLNNDETSLERIKGLVEKEPDNPDLRYMYGMALQALGYSESGRNQKEAAVHLRVKQGINLDPIKGSKNTVVLFQDKMLKVEVLAKHSLEGKLKAEMSATQRASELVRDFENFYVPRPVGIIRVDGKPYYVMEQASGELLSDKIRRFRTGNQEYKREVLEDIKRAADFMALLHAGMDMKLKERGHLKKIFAKLRSSGYNDTAAERTIRNLYPAVNAMQSMPLVYHKDCHAGNWITDGESITAIDFEAEESVRLTFDIGKLLDGSSLSYDQKMKILRHYAGEYGRYSGQNLDWNAVHLAYLNAAIIRAFEMYRSEAIGQETRASIIETAQLSIEGIILEFPDYYRTNMCSYDELYKSLKSLR